MTDARLERLVRRWQRRLGLERWEISVQVGGKELDPTDNAMACPSTTYDRGRVLVQPWVLGRSPSPDDVEPRRWTAKEIEQMIVHELLHFATRDLRHQLDELDGSLHRDAYAMFEQSFLRALEQSIDRLAVALVDAFDGR